MQKLFLLSSAVAVLWSIVLLLPSEAGSTPTAPRAPINVTADPGNARATISWDAPPSAGSTLPGNGGANITGYKVTVSPGGTTIESSGTSEVFTGLTNGVSYTFTVIATNSVGDGPSSSPSSAVVPATTADPPLNVKAASRDSSALIQWSAPASNGGKAITGYKVYVGVVPESGVASTQWKNDLTHEAGLATSATIQGLTNNTAYIFTVRAVSAEGLGKNSSASNVIKPHTNHVYNLAPEVTSSISTGLATKEATLPLSINIKDGDFRRLTVINDREGTSQTQSLLTAYFEDKYADHTDSKISYIGSTNCGWSLKCGEKEITLTLIEGLNVIKITAEDFSGAETIKTIEIIGDFTAPTGEISITPVISADEAVVGDFFFIAVSVSDSNSSQTEASGISSVQESYTNLQMNEISKFSELVVETFGLAKIGTKDTTHLNYTEVKSGLPVGTNAFTVVVQDAAGNSVTLTANLSIKSSRTNRNYFLFPGENYVGLGIIPNDGNYWTTDDSSIDRLMRYDISSLVHDDFKQFILNQGDTIVTLSDIIESTWAFSVAGAFLIHTPGLYPKDTLTKLNPHQGMIMMVKENFSQNSTSKSVFKKASYPGSQTPVHVPIIFNIKGVFVQQGEIPPGKTLRVGYNLLAPHALTKTLFDTVMRGALIPTPLTSHAATVSNSIDLTSASEGKVSTNISREDSQVISEGGYLNPTVSYWVYVFDDPYNNATNGFGDQLGPTITP